MKRPKRNPQLLHPNQNKKDFFLVQVKMSESVTFKKQNELHNEIAQGFSKPKEKPSMKPTLGTTTHSVIDKKKLDTPKASTLPESLPTPTRLGKGPNASQSNKKMDQKKMNDDEIIDGQLQRLVQAYNELEIKVKALEDAYEKSKKYYPDLIDDQDLKQISAYLEYYTQQWKYVANQYNNLKQTKEEIIQKLKENIDQRKKIIHSIDEDTNFLKLCPELGNWFVDKSVEHDRSYEAAKKVIFSQTQ